MEKRKTATEEEHYPVLYYTIHRAFGLDNPNSFPGVTRRNYVAISWIAPGEEHRTTEVQGSPDPVWKENFRLAVDRDMDFRFLNIEVIKLHSKADPGTSKGMAVVGRARIPLPKEPSTLKKRSFALVRMVESELKSEGHIIVSMEIRNGL